MAHGTGKYMECIDKATVRMNNEYVVCVYEEVDYYFDDMSDSIRPNAKETGYYEVSIEEIFSGMFGSHLRKKCGTGRITHEEAVKLWKYFAACKKTDNIPSIEEAVKYIKAVK